MVVSPLNITAGDAQRYQQTPFSVDLLLDMPASLQCCSLARGVDAETGCCVLAKILHGGANTLDTCGVRWSGSRGKAPSRLGASLAPGKHCRVYLQDRG